MAKHHSDLIMCRNQPGIAIGRLCEKCDGKCVICDSYVRHAPSFEFVMNATTNRFKVAVSFVEVSGFLMRTIARSEHSKKKIGTGARRLSISGVRKWIYSTRTKSMVLKRDDLPMYILGAYVFLKDIGFCGV
ncbi:phd finger-like domain-containing protein 5b [Phtheirospermum japonicum]|uniref:Phd finger-like domain-containing protein 5b n=1 Tax=Phtheirospermum japonicum TaxID=374723 RepID=A0A830DNF4_9LAMI|nr:phd finger-like domain-containing protein 5b [Phtheirospermum japonicum]